MTSYLLQDRIKSLEDKFLNQTEYTDLHVSGIYTNPVTQELDITVTRSDALMNSVKMWMMSSTAEFYRNPQRGGILSLLIGSQMNEQTQSYVESEIKTRFARDFTLVGLLSVSVTADENSRIWLIYCRVLDVINKRIADLNLNIQV